MLIKGGGEKGVILSYALFQLIYKRCSLNYVYAEIYIIQTIY